MTQNDPFLPLRTWRSTLFRGDEPAVEQFLQQIDAGLPAGWGRDSAYEGTRRDRDRVRWYLFDRPGGASVRVGLQLVAPTRVRAGAAQHLRNPPPGPHAGIADAVAEFSTACVLPAAAAAGVRASNPSFGPRSIVPMSSEALLTRLADTADGEWPLSPRSQDVWDDLVATGLNEELALDRNELTAWFEDSGWVRAVAAPMADRFFADSQWLAKRVAMAVA